MARKGIHGHVVYKFEKEGYSSFIVMSDGAMLKRKPYSQGYNRLWFECSKNDPANYYYVCTQAEYENNLIQLRGYTKVLAGKGA